ncbi:unnamed protein product [Euphydryas editha]|nr:unnamed protein product [Euphydryas editha]
MECDSMHSAIESAKKHKSAFTMTDCINIFRSARSQRGKNKTSGEYIMQHLKYTDFFDLQSLASSSIKNRNKYEDGNTMSWLKIKSLKVEKGSPEILFCRYDHSSEYKKVNIVGRDRRRTAATLVSNPACSDPLISTAKNRLGQTNECWPHTRQRNFIHGDGPPRSVIEDPLQQKILCLITPSAVGLHNPFDSDNITLPGGLLINVTNTVAGPEVQNEYSRDSAVPTVIVDSLLNENNVPVVLVPTPANKSPHPQAQMTSNNNDTSEATNADYLVANCYFTQRRGL